MNARDASAHSSSRGASRAASAQVSAQRWAQLVEFTLRAYVKHPEAVVVTGYDEGQAPLLVVEVDERDRGQVIGKAGRNLQSLERALALNPAWRPLPRIELQG